MNAKPVATCNGQSPVAMSFNGQIVHKNDLPSPETRRWVIRRKAEIVGAVQTGLLTREEAQERYRISSREFEMWCSALQRHGQLGLRATRMQEHRQPCATSLPSDDVLRVGDLELDRQKRTVRVGESTCSLTKKESDVLALLVSNAGTPVSKEMMLSALYGDLGHEPDQKILDVFVCKLRRKLKSIFGGRQYIETVWGRGFVIFE